MKFDVPLLPAVLLRRYKRFLADVRLPAGEVITVHCPNSGSMRGCSATGSQVMISRAANPRRKYGYTLEMVRVATVWVGINTARTNHLVREAIENEVIEEFGSVEQISAEVKTSAGSRLDFLLRSGPRRIFLEVKNCTLVGEGEAARVAMFPDAVTSRGAKHLRELMRLRATGSEAAVLFCVQRQDADFFMPAAAIDPEYAELLAMARRQGVMVLAYQAEVFPARIVVCRRLSVADNFPAPC